MTAPCSAPSLKKPASDDCTVRVLLRGRDFLGSGTRAGAPAPHLNYEAML
jgi:hypothetical protein